MLSSPPLSTLLNPHWHASKVEYTTYETVRMKITIYLCGWFGIISERLSLRLEDFDIRGKQILPFHALLSWHRTDQECIIDTRERFFFGCANNDLWKFATFYAYLISLIEFLWSAYWFPLILFPIEFLHWNKKIAFRTSKNSDPKCCYWKMFLKKKVLITFTSIFIKENSCECIKNKQKPGKSKEIFKKKTFWKWWKDTKFLQTKKKNNNNNKNSPNYANKIITIYVRQCAILKLILNTFECTLHLWNIQKH